MVFDNTDYTMENFSLEDALKDVGKVRVRDIYFKKYPFYLHFLRRAGSGPGRKDHGSGQIWCIRFPSGHASLSRSSHYTCRSRRLRTLFPEGQTGR